MTRNLAIIVAVAGAVIAVVAGLVPARHAPHRIIVDLPQPLHVITR